MNTKRKQITEEDGIHKDWHIEAKKQTLQTLPDFLKHLTEDYEHDYGTICHAITAAAVGAAWAVDHSEQGGITGFQAGCIMWEFMRQWTHVEAPAWLNKGEDMLYPQYADKFTTISSETWEWIKQNAQKKLNSFTNAHPDVISHWKSIVNGNIPFGYKIRD